VEQAPRYDWGELKRQTRTLRQGRTLEAPEFENLRVEIEIEAAPEEVYDTWLNSKAHSRILEMPVKIIGKVGGSFDLDDGLHSGIILDLVPGKRIVEAYRHGDWAEGVYSILTLKFEPIGTKTRLVLDQKAIPPNFEMEKAWRGFYLPKLANFFSEKRSPTS
jgi:uncharacterized protein YndB with AHSA1/START domain